MIVCTNCGFHNEDDDTFCGGCQEFLEWTGESVEADAPGAQVVDESDDGQRGLVERVVESFSGRGDAEGTATSGSSAAAAGDTTQGGPGDDAAGGGVGLANETAERAQAAARAAERAQQEADERAEEQARRTEQAKQAAEEAERVRLEAEAKAAEEAAAAERLREQLEAARRAREAAEEELAAEAAEAEHERDEAERRRQDAAQQRADAASLAEEEEQRARETERDRAAAEARLQEEQRALEAVQAQVEAAEQARRRAEEQATAEAEAAEEASRAAEQAERARRESEERAKQEAEAAEQARRAAALVARPTATPKSDPGADSGPDAKRAEGVKPTATPPRGGRKPRRRPRKRDAAAAAAAAAATTEVAGDEPSTGPVKPGRSKVRPPARTRQQEPSRKLRPGDLVCGQCGEGNDPERRFCRRCGNSLAESPVVKRPWYVRWIPRRKPRTVAAGTRPGRSGGSGGGLKGTGRAVKGGVGKVLRIVAMVTIAAAALGVAFVPSLRSTAMEKGEQFYTSARRLVAPEYEPVVPQGASASSSLEGHGPRRAIDNTSNRWWAEGAEGDGQGERLMVEFAEPVDIAVVGVTPGAADDQFVEQPRPRQLHLVFDNGQTADLEIADEHTFQTFEVEGATGVTSVEVQVIEVWQGQSGSDLSLTGLEFRTVK